MQSLHPHGGSDMVFNPESYFERRSGKLARSLRGDARLCVNFAPTFCRLDFQIERSLSPGPQRSGGGSAERSRTSVKNRLGSARDFCLVPSAARS